MTRAYRIEHSTAVTADDVIDAFLEYVARYSQHNQIGESAIDARNPRLSVVRFELLDGSRSPVFPVSGHFRIPGEIADASFALVSAVLSA